MLVARHAKVLVFNSLDPRYGSTYRIRALQRVLSDRGVSTRYVECAGPKVLRILTALRSALGSYDLLFTQKFNPVTLTAMLAARLRGKLVVVDWDDLDPGLQATTFKRRLSELCEYIGPLFAHHLTTHSEVIRALAGDRGVPVKMVLQGFEGDLFRPAPELRARSRRELGFSPEDFIVGTMCTFTSGGAMDLPTVLSAWAGVEDPKVRFLLVGGGPLQEEIEQQIRSLGLSSRLKMTGLLEHAEIPKTLAALDLGVVYISDSPANRARISLKTIELLAMNIPVVGQVVGETGRLLGALITSVDAEGLPRAIQTIAEAPVHRDTAEEMARFRWSKTGLGLVDTIESFLNR